jgi:hypothetical protein
VHPAARLGCDRFNAAVLRAIDRLDPRLVILNAHWIDPNAKLIPLESPPRRDTSSNYGIGLEQTLKDIGVPRRSVCIVLDVPTFRYNVAYALVMARRRGVPTDFLDLSRADALRQFRDPEAAMRTLESQGSLTTADPKDILCGSGMCAYQSTAGALYSDADHLSTAGALLVVPAIDACFRGVVPGSVATVGRSTAELPPRPRN